MITPTLATAVYIYTQNAELACRIKWETELLKVLSMGVLQETAKINASFQIGLSLRIFIRQAQLRVEKIISEVETAADKLALLKEATALQERSELALAILKELDNAR